MQALLTVGGFPCVDRTSAANQKRRKQEGATEILEDLDVGKVTTNCSYPLVELVHSYKFGQYNAIATYQH